MTLHFPITLNDYCEVRAYEFMSMKSFHTMAVIVRVFGILIIGLTFFVLRSIILDMPMMILFLLVCLAWILGFPYLMKLRFKSHTKRHMKRAGFRTEEEEITLTLHEKKIQQQRSQGSETTFFYDNVTWVEDTKKYVLIYDQDDDMPFIIPSRKVFETDDEREQFVIDLRSGCNIKAKNKKSMMVEAPRLKMRK